MACAAGIALAGNAPAPCTYQYPDPVQFIETRDALRNDAFAEALETYRRDLDAVQAELDRWIVDAKAYADGPCRSLTDAVEQFERDRAAWDRSYCVVGPVRPEDVADCNYQYGQLEQRRKILIDRGKEFQGTEAELTRRGQDWLAKAQPAVDRAILVLDPDHVEDALRLYISWRQRNSTGSACGDFAKIAQQLGVRVTNQKMFLELLARNLVPDPKQLDYILPRRISSDYKRYIPPTTLQPFAFGASGFKPRFRTALNDNQVRHTIAYMVFGYFFEGSGADLIAQVRDKWKGEAQDYWLGVEAGHMGSQLQNGTYDAGNFGRAIGARICDL